MLKKFALALLLYVMWPLPVDVLAQFYDTKRLSQCDVACLDDQKQFLSCHQREGTARESCEKWSQENGGKKFHLQGGLYEFVPTAWAQSYPGSNTSQPPGPPGDPDVPLSWDAFNFSVGAGAGSIEVGTPFCYDVRQHLNGDETATAVITLIETLDGQGSGDYDQGWTAPGSGDDLCHDAVDPGQGGFHLLATGTNSESTSSEKNWTVTDPGGSDPEGDATLFVQMDGSDSNDCSSAVNACLTPQRAHNLANPGDIIEVCRDGGGAWELNDDLVLTRSGTADNEIVLRVCDGTTFTLDPTTGSNGILDINGASYWIIEDIRIGDRTRWTPTGGGVDGYVHARNVYLRSGCNHIVFDGVQFAGSVGSLAIWGENDCNYLVIRNSSGSGYGRVTTGHFDDGLRVYGSNILVEDSEFSAPYGGHDAISSFCDSCVFRNVTMNNDWGTVADFSEDSGYRAITIANSSDGGNQFSKSPYGPVLFENSIVRNTGWINDAGGSNNADMKMGKRRHIIRYNYFFDLRGFNGMSVEAPQPSPIPDEWDNQHEHHRHYMNTWYNFKKWQEWRIGTAEGGTTANMKDHRSYNNLLQAGTGVTDPDHSFYAHLVHARNTDRIALQGYPNNWVGAIYAGNIIDADDTSIVLGGGTGAGTASNLAAAKSMWPATWLSSNIEATATFVNAGARTKAGFALQSGSVGEDDAIHMASVTANSSGTAVTLDDAYWIYDGFDLGYYGEVGDCIAFYASNGSTLKGIRRVASVNSQTGVTLTSAITIVSGDRVWPAANDCSAAHRNVGAAQ